MTKNENELNKLMKTNLKYNIEQQIETLPIYIIRNNFKY